MGGSRSRVTDPRGVRLDPVTDGWRELGSVRGGPVEQPEWAAACLDAAAGDQALRLNAVRRGGRLVAVAPMASRRVAGIARRVMLGVDEQHEPMDLLAADPDALEALAGLLARDPRPSVFGRVPADSPSVGALRRAFRGRGVVVARRRAPFPFIALDDGWREPERHLSSRRASDLRRAMRRAERLGPVTADVLTPRPVEVDPLLDEALAVERRSWKGPAGTAIACDPARETFIRSLAQRAAERGSLRLAFLRIGGRAVAMQIAMVQAGGFWLLKVGYDEEYARCSPGVLLLRASIAQAARDGLTSYEFLGSSEPWIAVWTDRERETVGLSAYPFGPRGVAALVADTAVRAWRPAMRRAEPARDRVRGVAVASGTAVLEKVGHRYVAGPTLADALRAEERVAEHGLAATLGFWDGPELCPAEVAARYREALGALGERVADTYVALKLPALGMRADLLDQVAADAAATGRRVHIDSLAPDAADGTRLLVEGLGRSHPDLPLGVTLPGRWRRSVDDAEWATARELPVRVVKGEWADPADPDRDMREGFLEVIDRLAGRAVHVAVATHDVPLAHEAVERLRAAGTPCGLELLYGLPMRASLRQAFALGLDVRVYVPYGHAYTPYALGQLRRRPRTALWIARDLAAGAVEALPGVGALASAGSVRA